LKVVSSATSVADSRAPLIASAMSISTRLNARRAARGMGHFLSE
jgi:hypothetical protein